MTFRDFKIKAKKILNILNLPFLPRVTVETYRYRGYTIYEGICTSPDFYCQVDNVSMQGSFRAVTDFIDAALLRALARAMEEVQGEVSNG